MVEQLSNELPLGWAKAEFQDIVDSFKRGPFGSAIKKEFFVPDGFKVYEQKNAIYDDPFRGEYYIDKAKYGELATFKIKPRDFIVSCSGTIGRILMLPDNSKPGIINQALLRIRIDESLISHKFFLYLFRSEMFQKLILVETRGSAMKNITGVKDLKLISITIPALPEQHRIVAKIEELFSELDNGIENMKKAREQLKTYRQAVLKYAFEGKLTKEWRIQQRQAGNPPEPAEELLEQIKTERQKHYKNQVEDWKKACEQAKADGRKKPIKPKKLKELPPLMERELAELPELPERWMWVKVGSLYTVVRGGSPRPAGDPKYYGGKIPFLKVADITGDTNPYLKNFQYTIKEAGLKKTRMVDANTLLISNSGATLGVPKICLIQATFNDGIAAFLGIQNESLLFHYYFWLSKTVRLRNINQGAAQPNLNTNIIADIVLPLCSRFEQKQIVSEIESRLSVCDKLEQTIEDSLKKAEALRQSILKMAFEGELTRNWREKHPELITGENSAEKLLEKIKGEKALAAGRKKPRSKKMRLKKVKIGTAK